VVAEVLGPWAKSFPVSSWGMTAREFLDSEPHRSAFATPLMTIDRGAARHNVDLMAGWLRERGLEIAPHGKTTMAPQLWRQLLDAGAWGITLATAWQVQVARANGIERVLLANQLIDPVALRWLATELADPGFGFACWVDGVDTVAAMRSALSGVALPRPIDVVVELGGEGGRTGARTVAVAEAVASAVQAAPELRLVGVGGYEGSYGDTRSARHLDAIERYLDDLVDLHDRLAFDDTPIVTAGGSAYFDLVAEKLGPLVGRATVMLRSGAYQLHDEGFYQGITPLGGLRSAIHGWARVISRPEPGLAILDGGKRDFPYDLGLPTTPAGEVLKVNDQHAYLRGAPELGAVLRLGLSHPCTAFDKWRLIPVVEDADAADPLVVDLVRTWF
jgi:D-serine deaminase-like pyridoxal phosphate-dependent protein